MAAKRRKTAWYMMGIVTFMMILFTAFLPMNPGEDDTVSLFTGLLSIFATENRTGVSENTRVVVGGDVMLGRSVMAVSLDREDTSHPFREIAAVLNRSDISFVNLENAVVENCPKVYRNTLKFCALPSMLDGLTLAGIDVVTLANNHSRNYGEEGLEETKMHLESQGIKYTDRSLAVFEKNSVTFGFLGFDFTVTEPTQEDFDLVRESDKLVDVLILGLHWGVEYTPDPRETQREWARRFVESGADVIAGHHPHWVQSSEVIDGVPVYYSLGNLVFDQMEDRRTKTGMLVEFVFNKKGEIISTNEINTYMQEWAQPKIIASENN